MKSQISAISAVFPHSQIVYGRKHIAANVETTMKGTDLLQHYWRTMNGENREIDLLSRMEELKFPEYKLTGKQIDFLDCLIEEQAHWLPSFTELATLNVTTSRIEGFFGLEKTIIDHKRRSLSNIATSIRILSEIAIRNSSNVKPISMPELLISSADAAQLGLITLKVLLSEFEKVMNNEVPTEGINGCCSAQWHYGIPCSHFIFRRLSENRVPLVSIRDFPVKAKRTHWETCKESSEIELKSKKSQQGLSYSELRESFEPYFSVAQRSRQVNEILTNSLNSLQSLKIKEQNDSTECPNPLAMRLSGAQIKYPYHNSPLRFGIGGAPKLKKEYKCKICSKVGHNKATCPLRPSSYVQDHHQIPAQLCTSSIMT